MLFNKLINACLLNNYIPRMELGVEISSYACCPGINPVLKVPIVLTSSINGGLTKAVQQTKFN